MASANANFRTCSCHATTASANFRTCFCRTATAKGRGRRKKMGQAPGHHPWGHILGVPVRALKQFDWGSIDSESRHSATLHPCKSNSVILGFKKLNHRWTVWTQMQGVKTGQNHPGHGPIHPGCGYADVARVFQRMGRPKSLKIDKNAGNFSPVTQQISLHLWSSP